MSLIMECEDLFLSYVAPYFVYQTIHEIILLDIQAFHDEKPYIPSLRFLYETEELYITIFAARFCNFCNLCKFVLFVQFPVEGNV